MARVTFEIEGINYEIPDYISIENYVKTFKIRNLFVDEFFSVKLLNILTGAPIDKLMEVNYTIIEKLCNYATSLYPKDERFIQKFEYNGIKYGFLPNWKDMSFGEFVDLDSLMSKKGDDLLDHTHIITAILYRPIIEENKKGLYKIEKYDSDTMLERAEIFKNIDSKYFVSSQFFFHKFEMKYFDRFQESLTPKMSMWMQLKILWKARKIIYRLTFKKDSVGMQSLNDLQAMILQNIIKSQQQSWWKRLTTWFISLLKMKNKKKNTKQ